MHLRGPFRAVQESKDVGKAATTSRDDTRRTEQARGYRQARCSAWAWPQERGRPVVVSTVSRAQLTVAPVMTGEPVDDVHDVGLTGVVAFVLFDRPYGTTAVLSTLMRHGWSVTERRFDADAVELARELSPTIVVLAIARFDEPTLRNIRQLREVTSAYLLVLIDSWDEEGVIRALDAGADGFVRESDGMAILEAEIRSILRQRWASPARPPETQVVGDMLLRPSLRMVECRDVTVRLTSREFAILSTLVAAPGRVLSPAQILRGAGVDEPSSSAVQQLKVHMLRIRRKLRQACPDHEHILNVRGAGYMFERRKPAQ